MWRSVVRSFGRPLHRLQIISRKAHGGRLTDEIESEQDRAHAIAFLDPALETAEWSRLDLHPDSFSNFRREPDLKTGVERQQDVFQLSFKFRLVRNRQESRDVIILGHLAAIHLPIQAQKSVTGEERFVEHNRFSPVFAYGLVLRQCGRDAFTFTVLDEFLLPTGTRVDDEPGCDGNPGRQFVLGA